MVLYPMLLDFHSLNDQLYNTIKRGEPASIIRICNTMGYLLQCFHKKEKPVDEFFGPNYFIQAGIHPFDQMWYERVLAPTIEWAMYESDILGFVDGSGDIEKEAFYAEYGYNKDFYCGDKFLILDPGALFGYTSYGEIEGKKWTEALKDKKVLVISTHVESIKQQWKNIDNIWGDNREMIAPFELVDVIRTPYHPILDDRQFPECNNWLENISYIKKLIDTYDYDILFAGSTASAPIFCHYAKEKGKIGIQPGGSMQLFFGLLGYRWTQVEGYKRWHEMFNEHWMYPLKIDEAQKREQMKHLEINFAYW